jgi:hypothetical protein
LAQGAPLRLKINTKATQPAHSRAARPRDGWGKAARPAKAPARVSGDPRQSVRSSARPVGELGCGITVYPSRGEGDAWRAVWVEGGRRRYREAVTEQGLAVKLEKVMERLSADALNMERPGADLIAYYLSPDRLPADRQWSRKHAHTQRRLCERFAVPVIAAVTCQDITTGDMQQIVNAAPTPGEGARVRGMISARDRRAPVPGGTQEPQTAADHLPPCHPPPATPWPTGWRPAPARPAPNSTPGPTRWG